MVAERREVISASDHMSQMAHDLRWFTNKLGADLVGESFFAQVNNPNSYAAVKLREIAFGEDKLGGYNFPAFFNLSEVGVVALLRELGFVQSAKFPLKVAVPHGYIERDGNIPLELVHVDKPFIARLKRPYLSELRGQTNILSIRYDPDLV